MKVTLFEAHGQAGVSVEFNSVHDEDDLAELIKTLRASLIWLRRQKNRRNPQKKPSISALTLADRERRYGSQPERELA